jgi:hypothetical protein
LDCPLKIELNQTIKTAIEALTEEELWKRMKEIDNDDGKQLRVAWSKDGRLLEPELNANILVIILRIKFFDINNKIKNKFLKISEYPGKRLQLHTTSITDSGEYKCTASNRAGQSYVKFLVEILCRFLFFYLFLFNNFFILK